MLEILPEELILDITQEDIDNGVQESCSYCPIALAVCERLGIPADEAHRIMVAPSGIKVYENAYGPDYVTYIPLDWNKFCQFIGLFDSNEHVEPITLLVEKR